MEVKFLVRWVGGKMRLIDEIDKRLPKNINEEFDTYVEPFVGGGSVMFHMLNNYNFKNIYVNDKNKELINIYLAVKEFPKRLSDKIKKIDSIYLSCDNIKKKEMYYSVRKKYNLIQLKKDEINVEKASLLLFLMRLCFNGVFRVNKKNEFNTSMGSYLINPLRLITEDEIFSISEKIKKVNFKSADFEELDYLITKNSFFYLDPPYMPEKKSMEHIRYTTDNFKENEQERLSEFINRINEKGAKFILSNSDTEDEYFYNLYRKYNIDKVKIKRLIAANSKDRKKITELMIKNY